MTYSDILERKAFIQVFCTTDSCPLNHSDLLVFSYLWYQYKYKHKPTNVVVADKTGVDRNTVTASKARLAEHGLLVDNLPTINQNCEWFRAAASKSGYATWRCFAKSTESPLTVPATSLLSFLYHCSDTSYRPRRWSVQYLATCVSMSRSTVEAALDTLQQSNFLKVSYDPFVFRLNTSTNTEYFASVSGTTPTATEIEKESFGEIVMKPKPVRDISVPEPDVSVSAPVVVPSPDPSFSVLYDEPEKPSEAETIEVNNYVYRKGGNDRMVYDISNTLLKGKRGVGQEWWKPLVDEFLATKLQSV